jgi:hypothetical protein
MCSGHPNGWSPFGELPQKEGNMTRQAKILTFSLIGLVPLAVLSTMRPALGGKPSPPLSLRANFESFWKDGSGQFIQTRIHNDTNGLFYVDTANTKKIIYGVEVKYYPPGSWDTRGRFVMKIDRSAVLGRFVRLDFQDPSADAACDESGTPGCGVDPLQGGTGELDTKMIEISTQVVLVKNSAGLIVQDVTQPIGMDTMRSGESKFVGLGITFTPTDPAFNYRYDLGHYANPDFAHENMICPLKDYWNWGPAELYCVQAGQVWEFRPCTETFVNYPDNLVRLLDGHVLVDYWTSCKLRTWRMPFVLRVSK